MLGTSTPGSRFTFSYRCTMMYSELTTIASASAICSATRMAPVGLRRSELKIGLMSMFGVSFELTAT